MNSDSHTERSRPKLPGGKHRHLVVTLLLMAGIIALLTYLAVSGGTGSWPEAPCTIVASRVVRADMPIGSYRSVVILYRGELQLRYIVGRHEYFLWADLGWVDEDRSFVQDKTALAEQEDCKYRVRYNPQNPAEAIASAK